MNKNPIVEVKQGKLKGKLCESNGNYFYSFQGIPYAKPPIGELRFKAPQPCESWQGILDATKLGPPSYQYDIFNKEIIGSEDCLNLNVYTPKLPLNHDQLMPVMFFIHGGNFIHGSNSDDLYGPDYFMQENVILVVINYRLGFLGFLTLEDPSLEVPGNAGFKDMVLALKWVNENILNFGGNANNVTVFGESAGAAAAHFLLLSPTTKGLIHRVICQSGCALSTWTYAQKTKQEIAEYLNISHDEKLILKHFQKMSAKDLLICLDKLSKNCEAGNNVKRIGLAIEKCSEEAFLSKYPIEILNSGDFPNVPIIIGCNNLEGASIRAFTTKRQLHQFWINKELYVPDLFNFNKPITNVLMDVIHKFYMRDEEMLRDLHLKQFTDRITDKFFTAPCYFAVQKHTKCSSAPAYFYVFTFDTQLNIFKNLKPIDIPGAVHADDLGYLFKTILTPDIKEGSSEELSLKYILKMWTNFARYGNPSFSTNNSLITWTPIKNDEISYFEIGDKLNNQKCDTVVGKRIRFWKTIYDFGDITYKL